MPFSGESFRTIASDTGYSESALKRHKTNHLGKDVQAIREAMEQARTKALEEAKAREKEALKDEISAVATDCMAARLENAFSFLDQLREVRTKAASLLDQAEAAADLRAAGVLIRELREQIKLMAELEGKLAAQPQVTLINSPEWVELRTIVVAALRPHPEALRDVLNALPDESADLADPAELA